MPIDGTLHRLVSGSVGPHGSQYAAAIAFNEDSRRITRAYRGTEGNHSEGSLVGEIESLVREMEGPEVQIYTYMSPCVNCTNLLNGLIGYFGRQRIAVSRWRLYWSEEWVPTALRTALRQAQQRHDEAQAAHLARQQELQQALLASQQAQLRAQLSLAQLQRAQGQARQIEQRVTQLERQLAAYRQLRPNLYLQAHIQRISNDLPAARAQSQQAEEQAHDAAALAAGDAFEVRQTQLAHQRARQADQAANLEFQQRTAALQQEQGRAQAHFNQQATNRTALGRSGWAVGQA